MQEGIHPEYQEATVICGCGNTFKTGSVKAELRVDVCSKCHPFFTGKQKLVDSGGRVDRFRWQNREVQQALRKKVIRYFHGQSRNALPAFI